MSKNIIFCADGTWNGPSEPDSDDKTAAPTNVFKLYFNLDGHDTPDTSQLEKEKERVLSAADGSTLQHAKYLNGVGDSDNFLVKALGGVLGAGLITRIVRGYTYLSRNYVAGDKIFLIGFSRGAYTARALAGLVATKGLLDAKQFDLNDKLVGYRLGAAVWYEYLHAKLQGNQNWLGRLEEILIDLPVFFTKPPRSDQLVSVPIEVVAVWDTVGSLGIPDYNVEFQRLDLFQFADRTLSPVVRHGLQAVAVDEMRNDFTPTLWNRDDRIIQVLFAGAHSDVGGGYPVTNDESALSDATLKWMTAEVSRLGVRFSVSPFFVPKINPKGPAHSPWLHPPWNLLPPLPRDFPDKLLDRLALSQSVLDRIVGGDVISDFGFGAASAYKPTNLSKYITDQAAAAGINVIA
jgi:uncharacterized protein (DUF2235 family)